MPNPNDCNFAYNSPQCNGIDQPFMSSPMYVMPGLNQGQMANSYNSSEVAIGSPICLGTPYSGALSYAASNLAENSSVSSPTPDYTTLSYPSTDANVSLSGGYSYSSQTGQSFGSYCQAQQSNLPSPFHSESVNAPIHASSALEMSFPQEMQWEGELTGASSGAVSPDMSPSAPFPGAQFSPSPVFGPGVAPSMQRTNSNASASSTSSSGSRKLQQRCRKVFEKQVENGLTNIIRPKEQMENATRILGKTRKAAKKGIKKGKAARKVGPRPFCTFCNSDFKGMHELSRHLGRMHAKQCSMFRIVDPRAKGKYTSLPLVLPLKDCKSCVDGKLYGADYNAAAHFRRRHYLPPPPKEADGKVAKKNMRGGKPAGSDPPLPFLREFFLVRFQTFRDSHGVLHEIQDLSDDTSVAVQSTSPVDEGDGMAIEDDDAATEAGPSVSANERNTSPVPVFSIDLDVEEASRRVTDAPATPDGVSQTFHSPNGAHVFRQRGIAAPSAFLWHTPSSIGNFNQTGYHGASFM